ncbi:MAG: asparaginase [Acidobacteria bacterium]|nr:asparaginase [Acidobacteriota bacterium]
MNIAVLNTGGTISCIGNPLHPMTAGHFAQACQSIIGPIIRQTYPALTLTYITDLDFPESQSGTIDSTNLQPTDWCLIASYILNHYSAYDGWIVLHGTDTMDFTASALPFLLSAFDENGIPTAALSKPVVITGSQVPMFYQDPATQALTLNFDTDAFQNFCGAVTAAQTGISEVCVYFHGKLFRGNRILKTNATEFDAFSSPNYPALGESGIEFALSPRNLLPPPVCHEVSLDNPTALRAVTQQLAHIHSTINSFPIIKFSAFPAWYDTASSTAMLANLIRASLATGARGLILESYGEGNFPSGNPGNPSQGAIFQALNEANQAGIIIIACTQVIRGIVNDSAYAAGAWLQQVGALNPADMTPMAAFAKLIILLSVQAHHRWSAETVKHLLQLNLLGERISTSRMDSRTNSVLLAGQSLSAHDGSATLLNHPTAGPILTTTAGEKLWSALADPPQSALPGRLIMQHDGNLVFYGRDNAPLWSTQTADPKGAPSQLQLQGSSTNQTLTLELYNYRTRCSTTRLFSQSV